VYRVYITFDVHVGGCMVFPVDTDMYKCVAYKCVAYKCVAYKCVATCQTTQVYIYLD